jgi:hypothetical protein
MLSDTLLHAIRILSVDVANASGQLAVYRAQVEEIQEANAAIDMNSFVRRTLEEGDLPSSYEVVIPAHTAEAVFQLLSLTSNLG